MIVRLPSHVACNLALVYNLDMKTLFDELLQRSSYRDDFLNNKVLPKNFYKFPITNVSENLYSVGDDIKVDNSTYKRDGIASTQATELGYPVSETFDFSLVTPDQNTRIWNWLQGWHLKNTVSILHNQKPGQSHPFHMDMISSYVKYVSKYYGVTLPNTQTNNEVVAYLKNKVKRVFVFLEDWLPGQIIMLGNQLIVEWNKGDVLWFDWYNVPHGTANFSRSDRMLLQVTGETTREFENLIKEESSAENI